MSATNSHYRGGRAKRKGEREGEEQKPWVEVNNSPLVKGIWFLLY